MGGLVSVLLVDDHALIREAMGRWLQTTGGITLAGEAGGADEAVAQAASLRPDVVVMDTEMPGADSFRTAQLIMAECPRTRIIFLSNFQSDRYIELALAIRAAGFLVRNEPLSKVADAIRAAASGGTYFSQEVAARIVIESGATNPMLEGHSRTSTLTPRELEVLRHLARGLSNKEIASVAGISGRTVQRHVENIMQRLNIHNRVELTRLAIREGLATP